MTIGAACDTASGWSTSAYLWPEPTRAEVHLARLPYDAALGTYWWVHFHPHEARWMDDPAQPLPAADRPAS